jgi:hypothetical protein
MAGPVQTGSWPSGGRGRITCDRVLLVEGKDDATLYTGILRFLTAEKAVQVIPAGGAGELGRYGTYTAVLQRAESDLRGRPLQVLAVIRDAGDEASSAFTSSQTALRVALEKLQYREVSVPRAVGEIRGGATRPWTGILIVPPSEPGGLETVLWKSLDGLAAATSAREHVERCRETDPPPQPYPCEVEDKSRLYSVLAVGVHAGRNIRPTLSLSTATWQGLWDFGHPAFSVIVRFLEAVARS